MRCIETLVAWAVVVDTIVINRNMRCIETLVAWAVVVDTIVINRNMRCIETYRFVIVRFPAVHD